MRMGVPCHELSWAFADSLGTTATREGPVVEKELQKVQVRFAQLAAQEEIIAQSRVEIFDERTCPWNFRHSLDYSGNNAMEFITELRVELIPPLPVGSRGRRFPLQKADASNQVDRYFPRLCDGFQLLIQHA